MTHENKMRGNQLNKQQLTLVAQRLGIVRCFLFILVILTLVLYCEIYTF